MTREPNPIDALLVAAIESITARGEKALFSRIEWSEAVRAEAVRQSDEGKRGPYGKTPPHRIVDRRLQALRNAGQIQYDHREGWRRAA